MSPMSEKAREQMEDLHETRRRGIEEGAGRKSGKRRGCGCGLLVIIALVIGGLVYFFQDSIRQSAPEKLNGGDLRQSFENLMQRGRETLAQPPDQILSSLRQQALSIQNDWSQLIQSGEAKRKLEKLRADLQQRRDAAGETGRDLWRDAIRKTDSVIESLADKKTDAQRQLRELDEMLERLQRQIPLSEPGPTAQATPEADNASENGAR